MLEYLEYIIPAAKLVGEAVILWVLCKFVVRNPKVTRVFWVTLFLRVAAAVLMVLFPEKTFVLILYALVSGVSVIVMIVLLFRFWPRGNKQAAPPPNPNDGLFISTCKYYNTFENRCTVYDDIPELHAVDWDRFIARDSDHFLNFCNAPYCGSGCPKIQKAENWRHWENAKSHNR